MKLLRLIAVLAVAAVVIALQTTSAYGDPVPKKYRKAIRRGLEWLAKTQQPDGHWGARGGQYKAPMTALAGVALLMEGSNTYSGKYSKNIRRAVDWLVRHSQRGGPNDGLITDPGERSRYMYGHGFSMLFLASVYGEERDKDRRAKLKDVLTRAVKFCVKAQSNQGGWYYTAAGGTNNDEGSVTVTQLQGLRACRNAGIPVPKIAIKKAKEYLHKSTTPRGGVIYRLANGRGAIGGERPALTAAALACAFSMGDYDSEYVRKWFKYTRTAVPVGLGRRIGHDEYTHFYYAQAVYMLGDDGWQKLFPGEGKKGGLSWSEYRESMFPQLVARQSSDGSWSSAGGWSVGPVYSTSLFLTIMQLDNNTLPIFQR